MTRIGTERPDAGDVINHSSGNAPHTSLAAEGLTLAYGPRPTEQAAPAMKMANGSTPEEGAAVWWKLYGMEDKWKALSPEAKAEAVKNYVDNLQSRELPSYSLPRTR